MTLLRVGTLVRLLNTVEPAWDLPDAHGVAFDSRHVRPGDAFFALPGATTHGLAYVDEALARGAAFVVADRPTRQGLLVDDVRAALLLLGRAARDRLRGEVVAVTGSVGKTSTKAMLAAALGARATAGNLNTHHALARMLVDAALEDEAAEAARPVVLELGIDHAGEMAELLELTRPDHALLTSVTASHLSGLGSVEGVAREKTLLLDRTPGVTVAGAGAAAHLKPATLRRTVVVSVASGDSRAARPGRFPGAAADVLGVADLRGASSLLTWWADGAATEPSGALRLPWPGRAMAQNALLALALADRLGVAPGVAAERLVRARLEPGRLERKALAGLTLLDDSYNSNPASLAEALAVLGEAPAPRAAFLADMRELGPLERESHLRAGELTRGLDLVVAVGPASRALLETNPRALHVEGVEAAAAKLDLVPPGATVLVKGSRSMGMERLVAALEARARAGAWGAPASGEAGAAC